MKKTIAALILAALAASPAMAGSYSKRSAVQQQNAMATGSNAYAAAPAYGWSGDSRTVEYGQYIGMDPDPNVQLELRRGSVLFAQ